MRKFICKKCGIEFTSTSKNNIVHCSRECRYDLPKREDATRDCAYCSKKIMRDPSTLQRCSIHFCNRECRAEYQSPKTQKQCKTCSAIFYIRNCYYKEEMNGSVQGGEYCSAKCKPKSSEMRPCECCGKDVLAYKSLVQGGRARFCSLKCRKNPRPSLEKFWSSVIRGAEEMDCWKWTGIKDRNGYGRMYDVDAESSIRSHRYSYKIHIGLIPEGMSIAHKCDNRECSNPLHLYAATHQENMKDRFDKTRWAGFKNAK